VANVLDRIEDIEHRAMLRAPRGWLTLQAILHVGDGDGSSGNIPCTAAKTVERPDLSMTALKSTGVGKLLNGSDRAERTVAKQRCDW
jgi:hypothetical protein